MQLFGNYTLAMESQQPFSCYCNELLISQFRQQHAQTVGLIPFAEPNFLRHLFPCGSLPGVHLSMMLGQERLGLAKQRSACDVGHY